VIADGIEAGKQKVTPAEMAAPREEVPEEPTAETVAEEPAYEVLSQHEETVEPAPEPDVEPTVEAAPQPEEVEAQ